MRTQLPAWVVAGSIILTLASVVLMIIAPGFIPVVTATAAVVGSLTAVLKLHRPANSKD